MEMYRGLMSVHPRYDDVVSILTTYQLRHPYEEASINAYGGAGESMDLG